MYPNPAQQEVTISLQSTAARGAGVGTAPTAATDTPDFEATLYNGQGQAMWQGRSKNAELRLNLRGLRPGLYQLRTGKGSQWENHQLQVTE